MNLCVVKLLFALLLTVAFPLFGEAAIDVTYFIGMDQHVHEIRFNGTTWSTRDLNAATGAPSAATGSPLTGHVYGTADNIYYIATDNHVHELTYYGSPATWHTVDATALAGAPNARSGSPLSSLVDGNADDIYYIATDGHIHELAFYSSTWHHADITGLSGAPNPTAASPLTSEFYSPNSTENTYYIAADNHVHQIKFNARNSTWGTADLNAITGAPNAASGSALTSHIYGNSDNIWYIATDGHIHEFAFYSNIWHTADITALGGAPIPVAGSKLAGNQNGSTDDVYFIAPDPHVHLLWFNGINSWGSTNVTALSGAPAPYQATALASHVYGTAENVYYFTPDQHLREMAFYSNSWHAADLTTLSGAPYAAVGSALLSFVGL
jgi:hypothetical protein